MNVNRRLFGILSSLTSVAVAQSARGAMPIEGTAGPLFIATWPFGLPACKQSLVSLKAGGSVLDAVEQGIRVAEADTEVDSVGVGGIPNANGVVQLDACIMDGTNQKAGAVAALEDYPHPISVARKVMERTKHVFVVGQGAKDFAAQQGFEKQDLLTPQQREKWKQWLKENGKEVPKGSHDTISLLGIDAERRIAGGCSTSGLAYKLHGRVGDSPLIGGGLYVDGEVGAAGATGIGENILRYCGTFLICELMRQGKTPTEACIGAIERIARGDRKKPADLSVNFVALDKQGRWGAAGTDESFVAAVVTNQEAKIIKPEIVR
ncbi:MAG: N(4)-(beta-N-acetylglucosaminyl)-L-asparaginase [Planctomycetes bacterium]|nr:N(4)-(beta-N-acetylglucosaminyl)-L-asparaginase [Planctomycetota bacterium]